MKKLILLVVILNLSCNGIGQEKKDDTKEAFDKAYRLIGTYGDSLEYKLRREIYQSYLTIEGDTVLLAVEEYRYFDEEEKDTIIKESYEVEKKLNLTDSIFMIKDSGELFLIERQENKYVHHEKIGVEYETFYDNLGEAHEEYFPASEIEHFKNNEYIVTYYQEGIFKIGIFEITEKGMVKKFLSKGCLIYDEWSEFDFFEVKNEKILVNYLKVWDGEEKGQIELKYENGEYSLDLDQCGQ